MVFQRRVVHRRPEVVDRVSIVKESAMVLQRAIFAAAVDDQVVSIVKLSTMVLQLLLNHEPEVAQRFQL